MRSCNAASQQAKKKISKQKKKSAAQHARHASTEKKKGASLANLTTFKLASLIADKKTLYFSNSLATQRKI